MEIVKALLGAIEDMKYDQKIEVLNNQKKYGKTPLHIAAKEGHLEVVELLKGQEANPMHITSRKHFPRTSLSKVGAKILLTLVNKRNKSVINDLYNYVTKGNNKAKKRLVNKMASVYYSKHKNNVKVRGEFSKVLVAMKFQSIL